LRQLRLSEGAVRFPRKLFVTMQLGVAVCSLLTPQVGFAYQHPLTEEEVRDAYFLGQDAERAAEFMGRYVQSLPVPDKGPDVAEIELQTPYAQVVAYSRVNTVGYSAQQALANYKQRGDYIMVRVKVLFTPTYSADEDFWRGVSVGLVQRTHFAARSVTGRPLYAVDHDGDSSWVIGANVYVVFSVAGVDSDDVQVEVIPPGGAAVHARFDLDDLQ
jgi:hypothetical protein